MTTTEFLKYLNKEVTTYRKKYKLTEGKAFGMWVATEYLGLDETDAFEAVSVEGGNDKDLDLFFVDEETERIVVSQTKFNARGRYRAKKNELLGLLHTTDWLKNPEGLAREGRPELEAAAQEYVAATSKGYPVEYVYAFCGPDAKDVSDAARQFNFDAVNNIPSQLAKLMGLEFLRTLHEESISQSTRVESCMIRLSNYFHESGAYGEAIVTTIDGEQLSALYEKHGDQLFDRNVRLFLGVRKGGVNAGIQNTLASPSERKNFWGARMESRFDTTSKTVAARHNVVGKTFSFRDKDDPPPQWKCAPEVPDYYSSDVSDAFSPVEWENFELSHRYTNISGRASGKNSSEVSGLIHCYTVTPPKVSMIQILQCSMQPDSTAPLHPLQPLSL